MTIRDDEALRACRQCYGSGECFHCSGRGMIAADIGGGASCHSCGGSGQCILCSGRGEVTHPSDQVIRQPRPITFAS